MFVVFESPFFRFPLSSLYVFYYIYIFIYVMANKIVYFTQYKINLVYTRDPRTHFIAYTWSFVNTMYNHKMLLLFNDIKITSGQKLFSFDSYKTAKIMLRNTRVSFMEKITERKSEKLWWNCIFLLWIALYIAPLHCENEFVFIWRLFLFCTSTTHWVGIL